MLIYIKLNVEIIAGWTMPIIETLKLDSLAPLSSIQTSGRWTSKSKFIGHTLSGKYYVRSSQSQQSNIYWVDDGHGGLKRVQVSNSRPTGIFLDNNPTFPFMVLDNFLPQQLERHGYGNLVRASKYMGGDYRLEWFRGK